MAFTSGIPAALQPTQSKALYTGNYIDFTDSSFNQWAQQFLPDVYEQEVERYGNRSIGSFLRMVSAEMPSTSDQIILTLWANSPQQRLASKSIFSNFTV